VRFFGGGVFPAKAPCLPCRPPGLAVGCCPPWGATARFCANDGVSLHRAVRPEGGASGKGVLPGKASFPTAPCVWTGAREAGCLACRGQGRAGGCLRLGSCANARGRACSHASGLLPAVVVCSPGRVAGRVGALAGGVIGLCLRLAVSVLRLAGVSSRMLPATRRQGEKQNRVLCFGCRYPAPNGGCSGCGFAAMRRRQICPPWHRSAGVRPPTRRTAEPDVGCLFQFL